MLKLTLLRLLYISSVSSSGSKCSLTISYRVEKANSFSTSIFLLTSDVIYLNKFDDFYYRRILLILFGIVDVRLIWTGFSPRLNNNKKVMSKIIVPLHNNGHFLMLHVILPSQDKKNGRGFIYDYLPKETDESNMISKM